MAIRGVCFDATGTLFQTRESVGTVYGRAAAAAGIKLPAWRLDDAFLRVMRHGPGLPDAVVASGAATRAEREAVEVAWWRDRVRQTFQATDSTVRFPDPDALFTALFDHYRGADAWQLRPGALPLLERLSRDGYRLGIASNFDHRLPDILEALGIHHYFDAITIPSTSGRGKPDRAVFDALVAAVDAVQAGPGLDLDALAYVGDDSPEVLAAIAAHGLCVIDVRTLPDLVALPERLADARPGTANLDPSAVPSNPARAEE